MMLCLENLLSWNMIVMLWSSLLTEAKWIMKKDLPPHHVFVFSPGILKSTCYIDVRWFPFDVQKCDLKFGSWTHNGWLLDLQMMDVDISTYIPNGEWDLVGKKNQQTDSVSKM